MGAEEPIVGLVPPVLKPSSPGLGLKTILIHQFLGRGGDDHIIRPVGDRALVKPADPESRLGPGRGL
jgi:hypothetical protein